MKVSVNKTKQTAFFRPKSKNIIYYLVTIIIKYFLFLYSVYYIKLIKFLYSDELNFYI